MTGRERGNKVGGERGMERERKRSEEEEEVDGEEGQKSW